MGHSNTIDCAEMQQYRAEAIKAYKAAVKAHPGILCEMDIEKARWER